MCTCKPGTNLPSALALLACTCSVAHTALACRRSHAALPPAHHPQARALTLLTPYPASNTFQSDRVSVLLEIQRSNACGNATAILALALQHRIAPGSCEGRIRAGKIACGRPQRRHLGSALTLRTSKSHVRGKSKSTRRTPQGVHQGFLLIEFLKPNLDFNSRGRGRSAPEPGRAPL